MLLQEYRMSSPKVIGAKPVVNATVKNIASVTAKAVSKAKETVIINGTKYIRADIYSHAVTNILNQYNNYLIITALGVGLITAVVVAIIFIVLAPIVIPLIKAKLTKKTAIIQLLANRKFKVIVPKYDFPDRGFLVVERKTKEGTTYDYITYDYDMNIVEFYGVKAIILPPDTNIPIDVREFKVPLEFSNYYINKIFNAFLNDLEIKKGEIASEIKGGGGISKMISVGSSFLKQNWWLILLLLLLLLLIPLGMSMMSSTFSGISSSGTLSSLFK